MATHYDVNWLTQKVDNGETVKFIFFWGHTNKTGESVGKFVFSQWWESPFTVAGITYKTAEHWMMAQKALLFNDQKSFDKIIACKKPAEAKTLGRQILGYNEELWSENKFNIARDGNIHKFNQNHALGEYLLTTNDCVIVEASPVDVIWGIGLAQDNTKVDDIYSWRGENLLGFVLMEVRDFLRNFGFFHSLENSLLPPWTKFPGIDPHDMFWRMGKGEDYIVEFSAFYDKLSERNKLIFQLANPSPFDWSTFYNE